MATPWPGFWVHLRTTNGGNNLSTVTVASGAKLELTYAGTDTVAALVINGTPQAGGVYGHTDSGATNGGQGVGFFDAYFEPGSGTLTIPVGFAAWITGTFANGTVTDQGPKGDDDNDGISNLLEFVLGGDPTISQAGIAPTTSVSGGNLVLTFKRSDAAELSPAVTVKVELSTDLTFSTPADDITVGPATDPGPIAPTGASYTVSNSGGFDTITVTIPQGAAPGKFARVKAIQTP